MADLATTADVQLRVTRTLTAQELLRAAALLTDASAAVRSYTGQLFEAATSTTRFRVRNGWVRLLQRPVNAVTAVEDINGNPILYTWVYDDQLQVGSNVIDSFFWEPWTSPINYVDVTYDHGYDDIPDVIVAIVCQMVARALGVPAESTGIQQESIAGYSYSVGSAAAAGAVGMLPDERAILAGFRRAAPSIRVAP